MRNNLRASYGNLVSGLLAAWPLKHLVAVCAWCGRVRLAGRWLGKQSDGEVLAHVKRGTTSAICPSCFSELAPGRAYPAGGSQEKERGREPGDTQPLR